MGLTGILFILAFGAVCWLALARHPSYGAMLYVFMLFLSPGERWWGKGALGGVRWAVIAALVTAVALIVRSTRKQSGAPRPNLFGQAPTIILLLLTFWMAIQLIWALDASEHTDLLVYYVKFILGMWLLHASLDSEERVLLFLRTYVACGFTFGWIAFSNYQGGRFEGFGSAGLGEANAGALVLVTSTLVGASLFLRGSVKERVILLLVFPVLLNGLITTVSRSGFLALVTGGLAFLMFVPVQYRKLARTLAIPAAVLFLMVAGTTYWGRMNTLKHAGEQVEGMDTGGGRLEIIEAQLRMFGDHPMGCGAMCTATLSPQYMDSTLLTGRGQEVRRRSSHNSYMSFLVEHGIIGTILNFTMMFWILGALLRLRRAVKTSTGVVAATLPALAGVFAAIHIGDLFVAYLKFEPRIWFLVVMIVALEVAARPAVAPAAKDAIARRPQ